MFSQQLAKFKIETKIKTSLRARGPPGVSGALSSLRILRIGRIGSVYIYIYFFFYIQCPPLILAPLVNMTKGGCENKSALFILFIFHSKKFTKFQPIIEVKQLKVGRKSHCEINAFTISCWPQLLQRPFPSTTALSFLL